MSAQSSLPHRTATNESADAVPEEDPSGVSGPHRRLPVSNLVLTVT